MTLFEFQATPCRVLTQRLKNTVLYPYITTTEHSQQQHVSSSQLPVHFILLPSTFILKIHYRFTRHTPPSLFTYIVSHTKQSDVEHCTAEIKFAALTLSHILRNHSWNLQRALPAIDPKVLPFPLCVPLFRTWFVSCSYLHESHGGTQYPQDKFCNTQQGVKEEK